MKTKILAFLLIMVLVVASCASCFGNGTEDPGKVPGGSNRPGASGGNNTGGADYPWSTTSLIYQMNENSNYQELPSTCKRFLAGEENLGKNIDILVSQRNAAAEAETKVSVEYKYLPDGEGNGYTWGENIDRINREVLSGDPATPDIYCNFVYDMVATSLKGSFANLLRRGEALEGGENYFEFKNWSPDQDDATGYMNRYMRSLTLSKYKMYCLSSDYFTDMVRAFFIVPVNVTMMNGIEMSANAGEFNSDRDGDGDFDIDDFYQLVHDKEWTYDTVAKFSAKVYNGAGEGLNSNVGFALASGSGLSASGMLYTTSITIIDRAYDAGTGEYTYKYPGTKQDSNGTYILDLTDSNEELYAFCDALSTLFKSSGVVSIGAQEGSYETLMGQSTALQAIRSRFSTNNVLFGGVICLGSLEYDEYSAMQVNGDGYGVVPVPLYRGEYKNAAGETVTDDYLTQIHNLGRVGAISNATSKYSQCTEFLNYQSTHSTDILNEYYNYNLKYDIVGTTIEGSVEMLEYIRANVRSSFDKAFEDVIGKFYSTNDTEATSKMWHNILNTNSYQVTGAEMRAHYEAYVVEKAGRLNNLENKEFPSLPE